MFEECRIEGDFLLSSGKKSNVFYDFDLLEPRQMLEYVDKLCIKLQGLDFDYVVSPAIGGIIPGWLVAGEFGKKFLSVDKESKLRGWPYTAIDATLPQQKAKYIIVDDVISTYGTAKRIAEAIPTFKCVAIAAFIFRGNKLLKHTYVLEHKEEEK